MAAKTITVVDKIKQMDSRLKKLESILSGNNDSQESLATGDGFDKVFEQIRNLELKINKSNVQDKISLLVFSGEFDKMVAAFIIATGAAAMGMKVTMFFTFWATCALKKKAKTKGKKFLQRMFGFMLPRGTKKLGTSHFNMGGIGPKIFRHMMKKEGVSSLEELVEMAIDLDVKIIICEMTKELLGIKTEELISEFPIGGVAAFLNEADKSRVQLFI